MRLTKEEINEMVLYLKSLGYDSAVLMGSGAFGAVFKVIYKRRAFAAKILLGNTVDDKIIDSEIRIFGSVMSKSCKGNNIACYLDHRYTYVRDNKYINSVQYRGSKNLKYLLILSDFIEGVTLNKYIDGLEKNNEVVDPKLAWKWLKQGLKALSYIHRHEIAHRDIKPDNMMIGNDNNLYLVDFGLSCYKVCEGAAGSISFFPMYLYSREAIEEFKYSLEMGSLRQENIVAQILPKYRRLFSDVGFVGRMDVHALAASFYELFQHSYYFDDYLYTDGSIYIEIENDVSYTVSNTFFQYILTEMLNSQGHGADYFYTRALFEELGITFDYVKYNRSKAIKLLLDKSVVIENPFMKTEEILSLMEKYVPRTQNANDYLDAAYVDIVNEKSL